MPWNYELISVIPLIYFSDKFIIYEEKFLEIDSNLKDLDTNLYIRSPFHNTPVPKLEVLLADCGLNLLEKSHNDQNYDLNWRVYFGLEFLYLIHEEFFQYLKNFKIVLFFFLKNIFIFNSIYFHNYFLYIGKSSIFNLILFFLETKQIKDRYFTVNYHRKFWVNYKKRKNKPLTVKYIHVLTKLQTKALNEGFPPNQILSIKQKRKRKVNKKKRNKYYFKQIKIWCDKFKIDLFRLNQKIERFFNLRDKIFLLKTVLEKRIQAREFLKKIETSPEFWITQESRDFQKNESLKILEQPLFLMQNNKKYLNIQSLNIDVYSYVNQKYGKRKNWETSTQIEEYKQSFSHRKKRRAWKLFFD
jgi:hypothetical protein